MKRLGKKRPWWDGEKLDCEQCGASWEMEAHDAFDQVDGDFLAIKEDDGSPPVMYVMVVTNADQSVTAARFICRDCGWAKTIFKGDIAVPRRLADQTPEQAVLSGEDTEMLEEMRKAILRTIQEQGEG